MSGASGIEDPWMVARASRDDLLSILILGQVAPQVGIKPESDSTKYEMVRNRRYRSDQIVPSGGVHTIAADGLRFSTCSLVCSRGTRHRMFFQSLKPFMVLC